MVDRAPLRTAEPTLLIGQRPDGDGPTQATKCAPNVNIGQDELDRVREALWA